MRDFTISTYKTLLNTLIDQGYAFQPFSDFLRSPSGKVIILRHDVDARKENSLRFAEIQHELSIRGSYYFRVVPGSYDEEVIRKIAGMGHEVGYHYETMDTESSRLQIQNSKFQVPNSEIKDKGNELVDGAFEEFCRNLDMFRKIVPVTTICMHGSPRSRFDNKDIWNKYDYRSLGIIGEPYFDIDFDKVGYLTDTGRRWNGDKVSVRDKVESNFDFNFRSTHDIIRSVDELPERVMFTFHPQRWNDNVYEWSKELLMQNVKNQVKYWLMKVG
ncbi:MAG: hypothetical protein ACOYMF_14965 [Bacteroidales bacterium]